ncbi:MAG: substrate-binding domain-containing protein [Ottowia sp.]|nr:substrate-binding domain-containing protein [Ottowia sp.]
MATVIKILLVLLWGSFLVCFSLFGLLWSIQLGSFLSFVSVLAAVAAGVCLPLWLLRRKHPSGRRFRRATGVFFALALLISLGDVLMGDNRYETIREPLIDWEKFQPFTPDNGLVQAAPDAAFRFVGEPPRMSGEHELYPVYAAAFQALVAAPPDNPQAYITYGAPAMYFEKLASGELELIFGPPPGPKELAAMREAKLRYTLTPLLREALVFFVHKDNPATGLTQEQLRAVYSGRVTSWRELGVRLDAPLRPYQSYFSETKAAFRRFMGDAPIMKPITEKRIGDVFSYEGTADYRNSPGAIGFIRRFFAGKLKGNPDIKFLAIDGVAPTVENIQGGSYPLATEFYAITARPREGNVARMIDFLRSPEGQRLIEASGYAPAPPDAADVVLE